MPPFWESLLTVTNDPSQRDQWTRLRCSIIGPLLAAPPGPGELQGALTALCAKLWRHQLTGLDVRLGVSTLERWYYAARRAADPVAALKNRLRDDMGRFPSQTPAIIEELTAQYREHPGWTMQLHVDNLRVVLAATQTALPSYPTMRRYLLAQGMRRQARPQRASEGALAARERLQHLEVRSFEVDYVSALWHLDFHHGSRRVLTPQGECA